MLIKNNPFNRKQIIFVVIGAVLLYIGIPNIFTSLMIFTSLIDNPMTDPTVLSISIYPTLLAGIGFVIGAGILIYKSKLLQIFLKIE